jgi:hypothetical protein
MAALAAARDSSRWTSTQVDDRPSRTDGVTTGSKAKAIPAMWASNAAPIEMAKSGGLSTRSAGRVGFAPTRAMACRVQAHHRRGRENSRSRPYNSGVTVVDRPTISGQFLGRRCLPHSVTPTANTGNGGSSPQRMQTTLRFVNRRSILRHCRFDLTNWRRSQPEMAAPRWLFICSWRQVRCRPPSLDAFFQSCVALGISASYPCELIGE